MMPYKTSLICALAGAVLFGSSAQAQDDRLPSRDRTVVMLHVIADKGVECDLLDEWEAMVIKIQARQERRDWEKARRLRAARAIADDMAEKDCADKMVTGWIGAARPNLSAEGLAPFMVIYQHLAKMDMPVAMFDAATQRLDYSVPIARIEAEFERLEAKGRVAEGGKGWDEYRAGLIPFLDDAIAALQTGEPLDSRKSKEALVYISSAVRIVETWLDETADD